MGEVYQATDTRLGRSVAIKRLTQRADRFEQEARAIAALNHPNICQIHDVGPDYLVMEYVEGASPRGPLPAQEAFRLGVQIAEALAEAHGKRILHRDLKPGNILVSSKGVAKLLDFGLAKLMADDGDAGTTAVMGTPLYMSPEQIEGRPLDERSDIFSFGVVLYEWLSGRRPFDSLGAVLRDAPSAIEGPGADLVMRCLAKEPAARFQRVSDVKAGLEQLVTKGGSEGPSIAVLPFANMSTDKEQEFFSDGLAEEIINALAQIPGLKVTARTSAFAFRGKEQDIRRIAEVLDVKTILEGSVRRSGNRIRVTAQLINAADGYHLWSQRYDRELADVFDMQDEMATAIAHALQVQLTPAAATTVRYKPDLQAYEAYLKGRHFFSGASGQTMEAWEQGRRYYERAISIDPRFAIAYCDLAIHILAKAILGLQSPLDVLPEARAYIERALDLDPSLPDAHAMLGVAAATWEYDWPEGERRFALLATADLTPQARMVHGVYLAALGRPAEAVEEFRSAVAQDPLFGVYRMWLALGLWTMGRDEEAVRELRQILEFESRFAGAYFYLALYHVTRAEWGEAQACAGKAYERSPHLPQFAALRAGLLAREGDTEGAAALLERLGSPETFGVPRALALFHLLQGDAKQAVDWWEKMIDQHDPYATSHLHLPFTAPLRPYWPRLMKRMNLLE